MTLKKILTTIAFLFLNTNLYASYELIQLHPNNQDEEKIEVVPLSLQQDGTVLFKIDELFLFDQQSGQRRVPFALPNFKVTAFQSPGIYAGDVIENDFEFRTIFVKYPEGAFLLFDEIELFAKRFVEPSIVGVNVHGVVLGNALLNGKGEKIERSFIFDREHSLHEIGFENGKPTFIFKGLVPQEMHATQINNKGQVVGIAHFSDSNGIKDQFFIYNPGEGVSIIDTPGQPFYSNEILINEAGMIAGQIEGEELDDQYIFLYTPHKELQLIGHKELADIGLVAMNVHGQMAGTSESGNPRSTKHQPVFIDPNTGVHFIGPYDSSGKARAINDSGQMVGFINLGRHGKKFAFLYDSKNGLRKLDTLIDTSWLMQGVHLSDALQINEGGEILCIGRNEDELYLLIPIK